MVDLEHLVVVVEVALLDLLVVVEHLVAKVMIREKYITEIGREQP